MLTTAGAISSTMSAKLTGGGALRAASGAIRRLRPHAANHSTRHFGGPPMRHRAGGAADRAGMKSTRRDRSGSLILGDIIVAVDGISVKSLNDLYRHLDDKRVGDTVNVTVDRDDDRMRIPVTLQALKN